MSQAAFFLANPSLTTIDFTGLASPGTATAGTASITLDDATFSALNLVESSNTYTSGAVIATPSDYLFDDWYGDPVTISFGSPVGAVGFNLAPGSAADSMTVAIYDGASLLDTETFPADATNLFDTYAGWYGFGDITSVVVSVDGSGWVNLDNVSSTSAVPEPGTLLLLGIGLGVAAARRLAQRG